MAWIKHYASKLAYLLWRTPSGQVAHATLDRRLCRTRIFTLLSFTFFHERLTGIYFIALAVMIAGTAFVVKDTLIQSHAHLHQHTFTHTHDGSTHTHTVAHSQGHNHYMTEEKHNHHHSSAELEKELTAYI